MAQLSSVLLYRRAAPCVKVSVLINSSEMVLTGINLNRLDASKGWHEFRFVIMGTSHLHDCLVLQQAQSCIIVASNHAHAVITERILQLEAHNSLRVSILADLAVQLASCMIQLSGRGDQDSVVR